MQLESSNHQCLENATNTECSQHGFLAAKPSLKRRKSNRRLVDYTKYRSDGTKSSMPQNTLMSVNDNEQPKKAHALGMPACLALEASLSAMMLSAEDASQKEEEDRIDFYLKVSPKSRRKATRVSTLDTAVDRKGGTLERSKSSRSLQNLSARGPLRTRNGLVRRSLSTPCA